MLDSVDYNTNDSSLLGKLDANVVQPPGRACFVAGTLVHTKVGLVSIEKLRVGDWVLSQPEMKGEQAYKRVTNTFVFEDRKVVLVGLYPVSES